MFLIPSSLKQPGLLTRFQPELDLCLRTALWHYSVRKQVATFGQQLLFICYDPAQLQRSRLVLHYILNVAVRYGRDVVAFRGAHIEWLQTGQQWADNVGVLASFVNFFRFLSTGKRPSIVDWILRLDHITMHGNRRRDVGYTNMSRELIWGGFMELLGFTLPLINYHAVRRKLRNLMPFSSSSGGADGALVDLKPHMSLDTQCAYCAERPTLPHHMNCSHIFCYYCLMGNVTADANFQCPICDKRVGIVDVVS